MGTLVNQHFSVALKELRAGVTICCWLMGLALLLQTISWSLLTFTDMRYEVYEPIARMDSANPDVLTPEEVRRREIKEAAAGENDKIAPADVNRQHSAADHYLFVLTSLGGAIGTMGALALLPMLALGVVLAAGSATPGVDRAAGAFVWAVVLVILALPWGRFFAAVPFDGLFADYGAMADDVERARDGVVSAGEEHVASGGVLFYGRYLILPLACLAGIAAVGLRFRAGIEAGLVPKEDYRLDPELEREAANIKATSLIGGGGRVGGALTNTLKPGQPPMETPSLRQVSPGKPLQRPI